MSELTDSCPRCSGDKSKGQTCSMFNTEMICMPCKEQEVFHPAYGEAKHRELLEVLAGNYNYPGIGKPADL